MKMEYDITKMVEEIAMQAKENQEEFIFETIHPYCENVLQIKINKEELKQILLRGTQKQQPCEGMRDATEEERNSTKDYIDSISKPTGLQFDDIYEELDFVQPHKKISVNLQPCEDYISREEAKQFLYERIDRLNDDELYDIFSRIIDDMYNELPPVTPQPKRGKWISIDDGGMRVDGYCSECNIFIPKNVREIMRDYCDGDFCPNCGARMDADMMEVQDDGI